MCGTKLCTAESEGGGILKKMQYRHSWSLQSELYLFLFYDLDRIKKHLTLFAPACLTISSNREGGI